MKAVIFDYGGVLCFFPPDEEIDAMAAAAGAGREAFLKAYWAHRHPYDRGDFAAEEYWRRVGNALGQTYSSEQTDDLRRRDVHFWIHIDRSMVEWTRRVRAAGLRTAVLSNLPRDLGEYMRSHMDLLESFDHHTFSYEVRAAKPAAAIYRHCVEGLGVAAAETLFIDDRLENIEGAKAFGLQTALFESRERFWADLSARNADDLVALGAPPVILE